jgi:hypothetical protein
MDAMMVCSHLAENMRPLLSPRHRATLELAKSWGTSDHRI